MRKSLERKKKIVEEIKEKLRRYKCFCLADLRNIKAEQFKLIRQKIGDAAELKVYKKSLIVRALNDFYKEKVPEGLRNYLEDVNVMPVLIFTNENPFKIARILEENKVEAFARPGDVAPDDIVVYPGPTNFPPGPMITELKKFGIRTKVEGGKLSIVNEVKLASKGDVISKELADLLKKLEIKPCRVTLRILCSLEGENYYDLKGVVVSSEYYLTRMREAFSNALSLATHLLIPLKENISTILVTLYLKARNLAIQSAVESKDVIGDVLRKGVSEMFTLAAKLNSVNPSSLSEELKEIVVESKLKELFGG